MVIIYCGVSKKRFPIDAPKFSKTNRISPLPRPCHLNELVSDDFVTFLTHKIHLLTPTGRHVNGLGPPIVNARHSVSVVHPQRSLDDSGVFYFTFEVIRLLRTSIGFAVDVITPSFTYLDWPGIACPCAE